MQLYQLAQEYMELQSMLEDPEMDFQAVMDTLESISGEFEEKADSTACVVKALDAQARAIKAEADTLSQRAKTMSVRADRLKSYLYQQMSLAGKKKIETARNVLSIRKTPASVRFGDEDKFIQWAVKNHPEYLRQKPPEVDKSAVRDALKAGVQLPGARLESGETFQIK